MGKKTVNSGYVPGDYFMECDKCGITYRRSDLMRDGFVNGLMVCRPCWDFKPTYPSPPPDRIAVPIARPENDSVSANAITYNYTTIGDNLFPDPWIASANDGLWTGGELSQEHVRYEDYSRSVTSSASITVTGLTVGTDYRFMASGWVESGSLSITNNGEESGLFTRPKPNSWVDDIVYFTATSTTSVIEISTASIAYIDGLYIQAYVSEDRSLTTAEILENTKPPSDVVIDNTVTPSPNYIEWGGVNIFPDPDVSINPTDFVLFATWNVPESIERSTEQSHSGSYSLKMYMSQVGGLQGGAYIPFEDVKPSTDYRFRVWVYDDPATWDKYAGFGVGGLSFQGKIMTGQTGEVWTESDYFEFTTPSTITNNNIYFGIDGVLAPATSRTEYYDSFELNEYINQTTPY